MGVERLGVGREGILGQRGEEEGLLLLDVEVSRDEDTTWRRQRCTNVSLTLSDEEPLLAIGEEDALHALELELGAVPARGLIAHGPRVAALARLGSLGDLAGIHVGPPPRAPDRVVVFLGRPSEVQ